MVAKRKETATHRNTLEHTVTHTATRTAAHYKWVKDREWREWESDVRRRNTDADVDGDTGVDGAMLQHRRCNVTDGDERDWEWWSVLQCVAVCCSVLHTVLQCVAVSIVANRTHTIGCLAMCCSVLQCVAVCCSDTVFLSNSEVFWRIKNVVSPVCTSGGDLKPCNTLQHIAILCNTLQNL